jgi:hypothetical protein
VAVPCVDHTDPSPEINEPVSVDIGDNRTFCMRHGYRGYCRYATRHGTRSASQQGPALRTRDLGLKMDYAGHPGLSVDLGIKERVRDGELKSWAREAHIPCHRLKAM